MFDVREACLPLLACVSASRYTQQLSLRLACPGRDEIPAESPDHALHGPFSTQAFGQGIDRDLLSRGNPGLQDQRKEQVY